MLTHLNQNEVRDCSEQNYRRWLKKQTRVVKAKAAVLAILLVSAYVLAFYWIWISLNYLTVLGAK